jgi:hypothetical protein
MLMLGNEEGTADDCSPDCEEGATPPSPDSCCGWIKVPKTKGFIPSSMLNWLPEPSPCKSCSARLPARLDALGEAPRLLAASGTSPVISAITTKQLCT